MSDGYDVFFFHRQAANGPAADRLQTARAEHPSANGSGARGRRPAVRAALDETDWSDISKLLADPNCMVRVASRETSASALRQTLGTLRSFVRDERVVGATHVRDWLLDLWSVAHEVDPAVAAPAESMLTGLVDRDLVSAGEILDVCDRTEQVARDRGTATV